MHHVEKLTILLVPLLFWCRQPSGSIWAAWFCCEKGESRRINPQRVNLLEIKTASFWMIDDNKLSRNVWNDNNSSSRVKACVLEEIIFFVFINWFITGFHIFGWWFTLSKSASKVSVGAKKLRLRPPNYSVVSLKIKLCSQISFVRLFSPAPHPHSPPTLMCWEYLCLFRKRLVLQVNFDSLSCP